MVIQKEKKKKASDKESEICQQYKTVINNKYNCMCLFFYHLKATEVSLFGCAMLCLNTIITPSVFNVKSNVAQLFLLAYDYRKTLEFRLIRCSWVIALSSINIDIYIYMCVCRVCVCSKHIYLILAKYRDIIFI